MSHIDRRAGIGTALEILLYSAVFCVVVLIPICVTSHNNAALNNVNNTYVKIDNLAMGNVPVCSIFLQGLPIDLSFEGKMWIVFWFLTCLWPLPQLLLCSYELLLYNTEQKCQAMGISPCCLLGVIRDILCVVEVLQAGLHFPDSRPNFCKSKTRTVCSLGSRYSKAWGASDPLWASGFILQEVTSRDLWEVLGCLWYKQGEFCFTLHCSKDVDLNNRSLWKYRFQRFPCLVQ